MRINIIHVQYLAQYLVLSKHSMEFSQYSCYYYIVIIVSIMIVKIMQMIIRMKTHHLPTVSPKFHNPIYPFCQNWKFLHIVLL